MGGTNSHPSSIQELEDVTFNIAVIGETGTGKSSLVNALRGMKTDVEGGAAVTDVIQVLNEPTAYVHPEYSDITLWDLPGIGTNEFKSEEYVKNIDLNKYDFFIIVSEIRFTEDDQRLVHAIQKIKRKFVYVRTKVDKSLESERENPNFSEEGILKKIRNHYCENLTKAGEPSPRVFVISRWHLEMYDFPCLVNALKDELADFKREVSRWSPEKKRKRLDRSNEPPKGSFLRSAISRTILKLDLENLTLALEKEDISDVVAKTQQQLDFLTNATLDIAITGRSGAGKSSLVNALRGMSDYDEGSAETGVIQTTMEIKGYPHPTFPKVTLWDLPGIGTPEFKAKEYLRKVNFSKYDFFIIVSAGRFTTNDITLAREIQKMKKQFYYVRTKIDINIDSEKRKQNFNEHETLEKIRNDCSENLKKAEGSSSRVFLVSRSDLSLYDFPSLHGTLEEDLDDLKRHAFIMASPTFSGEMVKKKKKSLESLIWMLALVSCFVGAVPVPGLSLACDISILMGAMVHFCKVFGLDDNSLHVLAKRVGKPVEELRSAIKNTPLPHTITTDLVLSLLSKSLLCATLTVIELVCDFVPVLGSIVGGASSFVCTFFMLRSFLQSVEVDAANVRAKATK
uniref:IRG-type G domain-containing protein n=1 Tax=Anolis carolinensis TaxID=28377 RepID=A0A803T8B7_ANOCA|nr:PREDICTED: interferon-inducible GTPase 5 [Anolis carolinensis]|eukprot:XP_003222909.1 PREDICTED: interferon-inducible GTPase 5 [Anolis carolinensis]